MKFRLSSIMILQIGCEIEKLCNTKPEMREPQKPKFENENEITLK